MLDIFITIHDQDLILRLEKNKVFGNLRKYKYLFLGNRPTDKLKKIKHKVIIVKDLEHNIEELKSLLDYTGWWAVAKNNLTKKKYVCFLQYDYFVKRHFEKKLKQTIKAQPKAIISVLHDEFTYEKLSQDKYYTKLCEIIKEHKNINLLEEALINQKNTIMSSYPLGNSFICPTDTLKKYIDWVSEPMMKEIASHSHAGHLAERLLGCFAIDKNIDYAELNKVASHMYAAGHDQTYYTTTEETKNTIERFLDGEFNKQEKLERKERQKQRLQKKLAPILNLMCIVKNKKGEGNQNG